MLGIVELLEELGTVDLLEVLGIVEVVRKRKRKMCKIIPGQVARKEKIDYRKLCQRFGVI